MNIDRGVLVHESSHAVIAKLFGETVEEVSAIRDGDSYGHMDGLPFEDRYIAHSAIYGTDPEKVHRRLLVCAAGSVGEFVATGAEILPKPFDWDRYGGTYDRSIAERLIEAGDGLLVTDLEFIVSEAFDLLRHPDIWRVVERVVRELRHLGGLLDYTTFTCAYEDRIPK